MADVNFEISRELRFGPGAPGEQIVILPRTQEIIDSGDNFGSGSPEGPVNSWEAAVAEWVQNVTGYTTQDQFEVPTDMEELSLQAAWSGLKYLGNRGDIGREDELAGLRMVIDGAVSDYFPDKKQRVVGRANISDLFNGTVVTPVLVLMRFNAGIWRSKRRKFSD